MAKNSLFVCRNNIARSQLAAEYYNLWRPGEGYSAGTDVEARGTLVEEWEDPELAKFIWLAADDGIEITKNQRTPLDDDSLRNIARVVLLDLQAVNELEVRRGISLPMPADIEVWDLPDPHHLNREESVEIRSIIKAKVGELVARSTFKGGSSIGSEALLPSQL